MLKTIHTKIINGQLSIPFHLPDKGIYDVIITYEIPDKEVKHSKLRGIFKDKLKGLNIELELKKMRKEITQNIEKRYN